jgi:SAM-dependent methyltransferase
MTETSDIGAIRAQSFGAVAAEYDKYRPRYPDELVADVIAMLPGRRVLDVGAGTGIATAAFAARGMAMTCVEPDPEMAAVLSAKLTGAADLHVAVASFEDWAGARPDGAPGFDGLVCAQAWHWVDPTTRWAHAGAAVRSGGVIALFWNEDHFADPRVAAAYTAAYDRRGIETRSVQDEQEPAPDADWIVNPNDPPAWPEVDAEAGSYFGELRIHRYHWIRRTPVADYVARINTTSAHLILPPDVRDDMTAEMLATLSSYGDEIELSMITRLATALRR